MALTVPFLFSNGLCCTEQGGLPIHLLLPAGNVAGGMAVSQASSLCHVSAFAAG